ncbi:inactive transglutaminase family protein [Methylothermus subterraneus]
MKNLHLKLLALALVAFALTLSAYKVVWLGLPLFPAEEIEVWSVEARLTFKAKGKPVKLRFALPKAPPGFLILDEDFVSGRYGLTIHEEKHNRFAEWVVRRAKGEQTLYYHLQLTRTPEVEAAGEKAAKKKVKRDLPAPPPAPEYSPEIAAAVTALLDEVRQKSADTLTFTRELLLRLNAAASDANVQILLRDLKTPQEKVERIRQLLAGARIPSRPVQVLVLHDKVQHGELLPWLQVHNGEEWVTFDPESGNSGIPENALIWAVGSEPVAVSEGGNNIKLELAVSRHTQEAVRIAEQRARKLGSDLMEFSLFSLPIQTQHVYRVLLMVPVGALLIVLLRNVVGIKTFGTFMPILIALAFRETELLWGVLLFSLVVTLGLSFRFYLEYLELLLVPRLASVLIMVIILMALISLMSHKLGLERGLSVALFPMVILTMTVERMALLWEEHGPAEALKQGIGSLTVAVLAFLLMQNDVLQHLFFVFPETLLIVLALTLLVGRYTGYRLTELWRFRAFLSRKPG